MSAVTENYGQTEKGNLHSTSYTEQYSVVDGVCQVFDDENIHNFGGKSRIISPELNRDVHKASKFEQFCTSNFQRTPLEAAQDYYSKYAVVAKSNRYWKWVEQNPRAWSKFNRGDRPFQNYFDQFYRPYHYTLSLDDLPITPKVQQMLDREKIFNPGVDLRNIRQVYRNSKILAALLREHLPNGAVFWKIEANLKEPHIHAVASHDSGLLHLNRLPKGSKGKCVEVYDPLNLMAYLCKPVFSIKAGGTKFDRTEATAKLELVIEAKRDFYQDHYQAVVTAYQKSPGAKKRVPAWVTDRGRAYARLPSMMDFYPLDESEYA